MARPEVSGRRPRTAAVTLRRSKPPQQSKPIKASETATEVTAATKTEAVATSASPSSNETITSPQIRGPPTAVFSIRSFCIAHGISEAFYFKLREQGKGPRELRLGSRVFVSFESAQRWRIEREIATAAAE
jgi:hypothetical protein